MGKDVGAVYCAVFAPVLTIVPNVALPPGIPFTSQTIAVVAVGQNVAAKFCVKPSATFAAPGDMEFVPEHTIVALALADFVVSAMLVAVTVTVGGVGVAAGAVYSAAVDPLAIIVPTVAFPPAIPFTAQVTPVDGLPDPAVTVAVKSWAAETEIVAEVGAMLIERLSFSVTVTEAVSLGFTWLTAVTVTLAPGGRIVGAVKSPTEEIVPVDAFPPVTAFTCHVTFVSVSPVTVAWNACVCPRKRLAAVG